VPWSKAQEHTNGTMRPEGDHYGGWGCVIGKYDPLGQYLRSQTRHDEVPMSFAEIEAIVGSLPSSARTRREWWVRNSAGSEAWRSAGWSVRSIDLAAARVVFSREPPSRRGWSQRHPIVVAVWVGVAATLIAAGVVAAIHLFTNSAASTTTIADQVSSCIREHGMSGASDGPLKPPPGMSVPFSQANGGRDFGWSLGVNAGGSTFGGGRIPVALYESCSWPPPPGADVTGYLRILVSTVPGNRVWGGEFDPTGYANVLDTSCKKIVIKYIGGHTGLSFSRRVTVAAGDLVIVDRQMLAHGESRPKTVKSWAQALGYYVVPGETVVLHEPSLSSISSIACSS
jgi:hypothetical protein